MLNPEQRLLIRLIDHHGRPATEFTLITLGSRDYRALAVPHTDRYLPEKAFTLKRVATMLNYLQTPRVFGQ